MNTLALNTELTHLTMNRLDHGPTPEEVLGRLCHSIKSSTMALGTFCGLRCTDKRSIGKDLSTAHYILRYEKYAVMVKLTFFLPRNHWEISYCSFI